MVLVMVPLLVLYEVGYAGAWVIHRRKVARAASDELERSKRNQQEATKNFRDPFESSRGNGSIQPRGMHGSAEASARMDGQGDGAQGAFQASMSNGQSSQQGANKAHAKS